MIGHIGFWVLEILSGLCLGGAVLGCLYLLAAAVAVLRFPPRRSGGPQCPAAPEPITILRPLHGAEPDLARRLQSFCAQDYGAPIQVVCGVQDGADTAIAAVQSLRRCEPDVELVIDPRRRGSNPKIANLANMLPHAQHDLLVIADSDIEVGRDYLQAIATQLQRPGVGGVTCLYHGIAGVGVWARLSALAINGHFLPNVVLALRLALARPCFGSTIALRRSTLRRIGGFEAFADTLADDYAIGAAIRTTGDDVAIPPFSVPHACFERSLAALLAHDLRVSRTIKSVDPLGYCGALITHPLPLSLLGILAGGSDALVLAATALACRGVLCLCVEHAFGLARQPYWLIPFRDLLSFAVYVWSLFGTAVDWRGAAYRVSWDGRLMPDRKRAVP